MQIYNWNELTELKQKEILARPILNDQENIKTIVQRIIEQVKNSGDIAIKTLTAKYDAVQLDELQVRQAEFAVTKNIDQAAIKALQFAKTQIEIYHRAQIPQTKVIQTCAGVFCERQYRPIERVGLYIPGGTAPLVSTVLMLGVPALIANCATKVLCTPCAVDGKINPYILAAAELCGIEKIYKVGGAQAIAAMAYGTETIPKVDKIFGPGNAWVTQAKQLVAQDPAGASIDMPAGPSEIMVIADAFANPAFVAADLLSQAEHGTDSQVILIALSKALTEKVVACVQQQIEMLPRSAIAKQALIHSRIIIAEDMHQAILISNTYSPEHLSLQVENPEQYISQIQHAGAVFLGAWSPETAGDYVTGSNHVLPTYGHAKSHSGLSLTDFMKSISFQKVTEEGLQNIGAYAEKLAEIEGLQAHKQAVSLRLQERIEPCLN